MCFVSSFTKLLLGLPPIPFLLVPNILFLHHHAISLGVIHLAKSGSTL
jgi:hypothetical protein